MQYLSFYYSAEADLAPVAEGDVQNHMWICNPVTGATTKATSCGPTQNPLSDMFVPIASRGQPEVAPELKQQWAVVVDSSKVIWFEGKKGPLDVEKQLAKARASGSLSHKEIETVRASLKLHTESKRGIAPLKQLLGSSPPTNG